MSAQPTIVPADSERQTCDGHMLSGRPATIIIQISGLTRLALCNECAASIQQQIAQRKLAEPKAKPINPETLGEGKGPDFCMLPVTPTRVRP